VAERPRLGFLRIGWELIEPDARGAIERYLQAATAAGAQIEEAELPVALELLVEAQLTIQRVETAAALGAEADWHGEHVSPALRAFIAEGRGVSGDEYLAARRLADEQRWRWSDRIERFDAVLAPSTLGVPPLGLESTGDPLLCRPFTLLGGPAVALPGALRPTVCRSGCSCSALRSATPSARGGAMAQRARFAGPLSADASTVGA